MFEFAHPYFLFLALPVGVAAWCIYRRGVKRGVLFSATHYLGKATRSWRMAVAGLVPLLLLAGALLMVVALARPRTVLSRSHRSTDAIAIQMVVDTSGSMVALDLSIKTATGMRYRTRLDAVKETFADFIAERPDDLIGLITFGGYATTRTPLTLDHRALAHALSGVEIPKQAYDDEGNVLNQEELLTAIGDAMATACARLEKAEPETRIIVLLSDGESNTGIIKPETAVKAARKLGIKVYTIGVGTTGKAPFMGKDVFGREAIGYADVVLDEKLLTSIADQTGGRYFNVSKPEELETTMASIGELEKTTIERDVYFRYRERFPEYLGLGLALCGLGLALNVFITRRLI